MPKVSSFYGIIIMMYFRDHNPPHFHAKYGEFTAEILIDNLGLKEGYLPAKALALVVEWALIHKEELKKNWEQASQGKEILPIEPLL